MILIDGNAVSAAIRAELKAKVDALRSRGITPGLAVVLAGDDPGSQVYVRNKVKAAGELGLYSEKHELPASVGQDELLALVRRLNDDPRIHGILVQSPPPKQIDERAIIETLRPDKDVDCFHPYNVGKLLIGDEDGFLPCTPAGVMELLARSGVPVAGKRAVVLGRSNIVGKPMAVLLARKGQSADATVTLCHSRTRDLAAVCREADVLVVAIGRAKFVTADMVKAGAAVIDVGMNRIADPTTKSGTRLCGDVDFAAVAPKAGWITPVPGGVGPMTITMLMRNALVACCRMNGVDFSAL